MEMLSYRMFMAPLATVLVMFLALPSEVSSLNCFQCNSGIHPECPDLKANETMSTYYRPCEENYGGHKPFCRKIVQRIVDRDGLVRVVRSCGWVKHPRLECYHVDDKDHSEIVCQCFTDGCNGATTLHRSTVFVLSLVAMVTAHWNYI